MTTVGAIVLAATTATADPAPPGPPPGAKSSAPMNVNPVKHPVTDPARISTVRDLVGVYTVETSVLGIVVTAVSVVVMPGLGVLKRRLGARLGSAATAGEGTQNLLCAAQAAAVLIGLAVNAVTGVNWLDPVIALALAAWAVREGWEAWDGEDCC